MGLRASPVLKSRPPKQVSVGSPKAYDPSRTLQRLWNHTLAPAPMQTNCRGVSRQISSGARESSTRNRNAQFRTSRPRFLAVSESVLTQFAPLHLSSPLRLHHVKSALSRTLPELASPRKPIHLPRVVAPEVRHGF